MFLTIEIERIGRYSEQGNENNKTDFILNMKRMSKDKGWRGEQGCYNKRVEDKQTKSLKPFNV